MAIKLRCYYHPSYRALREPRADCPGCQQLWAFVNRLVPRIQIKRGKKWPRVTKIVSSTKEYVQRERRVDETGHVYYINKHYKE